MHIYRTIAQNSYQKTGISGMTKFESLNLRPSPHLFDKSLSRTVPPCSKDTISAAVHKRLWAIVVFAYQVNNEVFGLVLCHCIVKERAVDVDRVHKLDGKYMVLVAKPKSENANVKESRGKTIEQGANLLQQTHQN